MGFVEGTGRVGGDGGEVGGEDDDGAGGEGGGCRGVSPFLFPNSVFPVGGVFVGGGGGGMFVSNKRDHD